MLPAHLFHHPSRVLAGCVVLALCGCASEALNQQLANSKEAVDQARIAGAAEKAPADFETAVDKMNRASAAADKREKTDAMRLAEEAQVDANLARAKTDTAQARLAAAELEKSNQILRDYHRENQNQQR